MSQLFIAFITGLTTGGLSCLAVQGGLLASSLAHQLEQDTLNESVHKGRKSKKQPQQSRRQVTRPILFFLGAKVVAYSLLGFLLGWVGSLLTLNATMKAGLLFVIGFFMLGNALRMLNVHPIFRYFSFEPPSFLTRFIRRKAKNGTDWFTPIFLGGLTVFIPCGVTQAMMAVAMGTGNPLAGAAIMLAFTLGASPVFFLVATFTAQIGARMEKIFTRFVAVVVLVMGLVSVNNGIALMGGASLGNLIKPLSQPVQVVEVLPENTSGILVLTANNNGYYPQEIHAKAGEALKLDVVTKNTFSCARDFLIPVLRVEKLLPQTGKVTINLPAQESGTVMRFTCSMGMYTGKIIFDQ